MAEMMPKDHAQGAADHQGRDGQLDGGGKALPDLDPDLLARPDGLAQIQCRQAFEEQAILDVKRFVQTQVLPQVFQGFVRGALAQQELGGVPGGEVEHEENDDRHPQEGRDEDQDSAEDISSHGGKKGFEGSRVRGVQGGWKGVMPPLPT